VTALALSRFVAAASGPLGIGWGKGWKLGFKECTRVPEWAIGPESYPMGQKRTNRTHCSNSCSFFLKIIHTFFCPKERDEIVRAHGFS